MKHAFIFTRVAAALAAFLAFHAEGFAQSAVVNPDGSVDVPAFTLPFSSLASPEARDHVVTGRKQSEMLAKAKTDLELRKAYDDVVVASLLPAHKARYAVTIEEKTIAGVFTQVFTPNDGIAPKNKNRVLINLHGGGFRFGGRTVSLLESMPLASIGKIKVISIDYRQWPEHRFPAASEDVAAVYKELLKTYKPADMIIYGCSAGGMLSAESIGWFQKEGLPNPAAIGLFCASTDSAVIGDSAYTTPRIGGGGPPPPADNTSKPFAPAYFQGADLQDPLVAPYVSPALLAKFPPTLMITGTRSTELSVTVHSHIKLVKLGVDARLFIWDGLDHAFFYNPALPESQEAYAVMLKFFTEQMDKANGT